MHSTQILHEKQCPSDASHAAQGRQGSRQRHGGEALLLKIGPRGKYMNIFSCQSLTFSGLGKSLWNTASICKHGGFSWCFGLLKSVGPQLNVIGMTKKSDKIESKSTMESTRAIGSLHNELCWRHCFKANNTWIILSASPLPWKAPFFRSPSRWDNTGTRNSVVENANNPTRVYTLHPLSICNKREPHV